MTELTASEWHKGGLRYAKLKEIVPKFLAPAEVHAFFVGVKGRGRRFRLVNPFTPLQREYVVAATSDGLTILRLRRPGVFRASIAGVAHRSAAKDVNLRWEAGRLTIDGVSYQPISFHEDDAEQVARLFGQALDE